MQLQQTCFALSAPFLLLAMQLQQTCVLLPPPIDLQQACFALYAAFLLLAAMLRQIHTHCSAIHKKTVVLCERGSHPILPRCDVR